MPIAVQCQGCKTTFKVKDELAGRRAKCPKCQGILEVPARQPADIAKSAVQVVEAEEGLPVVRAVLTSKNKRPIPTQPGMVLPVIPVSVDPAGKKLPPSPAAGAGPASAADVFAAAAATAASPLTEKVRRRSRFEMPLWSWGVLFVAAVGGALTFAIVQRNANSERLAAKKAEKNVPAEAEKNVPADVEKNLPPDIVGSPAVDSKGNATPAKNNGETLAPGDQNKDQSKPADPADADSKMPANKVAAPNGAGAAPRAPKQGAGPSKQVVMAADLNAKINQCTAQNWTAKDKSEYQPFQDLALIVTFMRTVERLPDETQEFSAGQKEKWTRDAQTTEESLRAKIWDREKLAKPLNEQALEWIKGGNVPADGPGIFAIGKLDKIVEKDGKKGYVLALVGSEELIVVDAGAGIGSIPAGQNLLVLGMLTNQIWRYGGNELIPEEGRVIVSFTLLPVKL